MFNGSKIEFGGFVWLVLETQKDRSLIIAEDIIQIRLYHEEPNSTWHDCSLRKYLNDEFYNTFREEDKAKIIMTTNTTLVNPWFNVSSGKDTDDRIFLLSLEEVCRYFGDSSANLKSKGNQDLIGDANNINRKAKFNGKDCWWWLRSVGHGTDDAARVSRSGRIDVRGDYINDGVGGGVRPALWLNFEPEKQSKTDGYTGIGENNGRYKQKTP